MTMQRIPNKNQADDYDDDDSWTEEEVSDSDSSSSSIYSYYYEEVVIADDKDGSDSDDSTTAKAVLPPTADRNTAVAAEVEAKVAVTNNRDDAPDESSTSDGEDGDRWAAGSDSTTISMAAQPPPRDDLRCGTKDVDAEPDDGIDKTVVVESNNNYGGNSWFDVRWIRATILNPSVDVVDNNDNRTKTDDDKNSSYYYYFGCIALRDIPRHTLIHTEDPLLQGEPIWTAMERKSRSLDTSRGDDDNYLRDHCHLSKIQRQKLWSLHDQRNNDSNNDNDKRLMGIIYSNAFYNSDFEEPALFVGPATRFNHSCSPNMGFNFNGPKIRLFTTRRVSRGDELLYCYNDVVYHHSTKVRRAFLKSTYGFDCACAACHAGGGTTTSSDMRRRSIHQLARHLSIHAGASLLYNEGFEDTIGRVREEDEEDASISDTAIAPSPSAGGSPTDVSLWQTCIEYLGLLRTEGLDHDLLRCHHFGYEWAVKIFNHKRRAAAATEDAPIIIVNRDTVLGWGSKTLALHELQKGHDHASTNAFRVMFRKWEDENTT